MSNNEALAIFLFDGWLLAAFLSYRACLWMDKREGVAISQKHKLEFAVLSLSMWHLMLVAIGVTLLMERTPTEQRFEQLRQKDRIDEAHRALNLPLIDWEGKRANFYPLPGQKD